MHAYMDGWMDTIMDNYKDIMHCTAMQPEKIEISHNATKCTLTQ